MDSFETIAVLGHIIHYVRQRHDHLPDGKPYVNSLLLEAHLMELIGRLTFDPDIPVRFGATGQVQLRDLHNRELTQLYERIGELEEAVGYDDELNAMGYEEAHHIVYTACASEEQQEAFKFLMDERNAYVSEYVKAANENADLRKQVERLTDMWQTRCEGCVTEPCPIMEDKLTQAHLSDDIQAAKDIAKMAGLCNTCEGCELDLDAEPLVARCTKVTRVEHEEA